MEVYNNLPLCPCMDEKASQGTGYMVRRGSLMKLACVYISAQHFHETVAFYEQLLEQVGKEITPNRWVEFSCGHTLAV
ncbi:hypothetical protein L0N00_14875, partial [Eggerthella lenta]|nr:hypothetical protein [Eggerthella lenta]